MAGSPDGPAAGVPSLFDRVADSYENVGVPWFAPIAQGLVDLLAPQPGEHVVDVGCGRGAVLFPVADAVGPTGRVVGLDLSARMVELTSAQVRERALTGVEVVRADAATPGLPAGQADVVASSLVLFFLPDPAQALAAWVDLLRPGGRLGVSTFAGRSDLWVQVDALFRPYLPARMLDARASGQTGPFADDAGVEGLLRGAGLVDVRTEHRDVEVGFPDVAAWVTWSQSHGQRAMWDAVPDDARLALAAEAAGLLADGAGPDGVTRLTQTVRYTLGSVAGAAPPA